ncbi:protein of unknown function [Cupriavidus neocaledonicus]|uniref:Uncharacterized protein n=1 Tax=Cupriavidus neocaledonicus TaxID=1040979 RepID=A0A375H4W0_9BURK|nr:protein of unknown function [Cupriavidus neocaledonicus]
MDRSVFEERKASAATRTVPEPRPAILTAQQPKAFLRQRPQQGPLRALGSFNHHANAPATVVHPCGRQSSYVRKPSPVRKLPGTLR